jgi:hypothetical protein
MGYRRIEVQGQSACYTLITLGVAMRKLRQ